MNKLIIFTAEWCRPCNRLKSNLNSINAELLKNVTMYDVDINVEQAVKYNVSAVPTIITLDSDGNEVTRRLGVLEDYQITRIIENV